MRRDMAPGSTLGTLGGLASRVMSFVGRLSKRPLSVPLLAIAACRWRVHLRASTAGCCGEDFLRAG